MKSALVCLVLVAAAMPVHAHHSAAGIDRTQMVTISGTLKQFSWTNPHSWMELEVPGDKGIVTWNVEMTSPAVLVRAGWKSSTIKAGDKLTVVLRPFRNGDPGGLFVSVTLPDGRVLSERAAAATPPAAAPAAAPK